MKKVSVIIPVYNVENYLEQCLDSVISQTEKKLEIICINDGSTDNSLRILEKYVALDTRIVAISQNNQGLAGARNTGLRYASAPYVCFCDSDDFYDPEFCEKMLAKLEESGSDLTACELEVVYEADFHMRESDREFYRLKYAGTVDSPLRILNNMDRAVYNKVYRRSIIDRNNIAFPAGLNHEDVYFNWKYFYYARNCSFVNEKLYFYRRRKKSIMSKTFENGNTCLDYMRVMFDLKEFMLAENALEKYQKEFSLMKEGAYNFCKRYMDPNRLDELREYNDSHFPEYSS